jgi:hypothetical protein
MKPGAVKFLLAGLVGLPLLLIGMTIAVTIVLHPIESAGKVHPTPDPRAVSSKSINPTTPLQPLI